MSVPLRLFGATETAVRLWGPVGTVVACFCTFLIGRLLFSARVGVWAMVVLATTPMMYVDGTVAMVDAVLLAFTVTATLAFVLSVVRGPRLWHWVLLTLALTGAQLTKGPVGLLPVLTIVATLWFGRRVLSLGRGYLLACGAAVVVSLALFLVWFVPADRATGGELFREAVGTHLIGRSLRAMEGHGATTPFQYMLYLVYYPAIAVAAFFPWTLYLGGSLSMIGRHRTGHPAAGVLLWSWILSTLALMSLVATKIPHYVLSIWPALALAVGAALENRDLARPDHVWMRAGSWSYGGFAVVCAAALIAGSWKIAELTVVGAVGAAILLLAAVTAIRYQLTRRYVTGARFTAISMAVLMVWLSGAFVPRLDAFKPVPAIGRAVQERAQADAQIAAFGFEEPTLNFYVGRPIRFIDREDLVGHWARADGPGVLILTTEALDRIETAHGPLHLERFATSRGFNFVKGRSVELFALER
jgi:4-amino-4-deoxy-L-arabinose transferase-like glycosyltransferase